MISGANGGWLVLGGSGMHQFATPNGLECTGTDKRSVAARSGTRVDPDLAAM